MRPRSTRLVAALVVVTAVAACDGGGDDASSTSGASNSSSTETTVVPPESSEPEPTTTSSTSTSTTVSTTTTTTTTTLPDDVPPRVTFPDDPEKQAVVDAIYAYFDTLGRAQADPANESLRDEMAATVIDPIRPRVIAFLQSAADEGRAYFTVVDNPSYIDVTPDVVSINSDSALADACVFDSDVEVEVGANPDGSDKILDDSVVSVTQTYHLNRTEDGWKVSDLTIYNRWEGQRGCG